MKTDKCLVIVAIVALVAIVSLVLVFKSEKTGMLNLCPTGYDSFLEALPGGGQQVHCVKEVMETGDKFDTYSRHPQGDYRRQIILQYGYGPLVR